ncbi:MAG: PDZ domain-containing protein [Acidobacteriota bacterium]
MSRQAFLIASLLAFSLLAAAPLPAAPGDGSAAAAAPEAGAGQAMDDGMDAEAGEPLSPVQKKDLERRLSEARRRLAEAERQVAELEARLSEAGVRKVDVLKAITSKPRLGVLLETDPDPEVDAKGVLVRGVSPGGPAAEAGLQAGDILTRLNGTPLYPGGGEAAVKKIGALLEGMKEGDAVQVEYLRGKEKRSATVKIRPLAPQSWNFDFEDLEIPELGDLPEVPGKEIRIPKVRVVLEDRLPGDWYDLELAPVNPGLGKYFGASEGLLVVNAPEGNGLKVESGDILLKIGGRKPSTPAQAFRILRSYEPGEKFALEILRERKPLEIQVAVPPESPSRKEKGFRWEERGERPGRRPKPPVAAVAPAPPQPPAPPAPGPRT